MDYKEIDGSFGEGGGQIIRTSLTLSAITQTPIKIFNIRPFRKPKPHLQAQHLMAVKAVREITSGELHHAQIGSAEFEFIPKRIKAGEYIFDIGTAGSSILVAQTIIPILLHADGESTIKIRGGTHIPNSPGFDYFANVFIPAITRFNANVTCDLLRSGYYPKGNGFLEIKVSPSILKGNVDWHNHMTSMPQAIIRVAKLPRSIAEREMNILTENQIFSTKIIEEESLSPGNAITIWNKFNGSNSLGRPGKLAEIVAKEAVYDFLIENKEVDIHLADQILLYAALASGKSEYITSKISNHFVTNKFIVTQFLNNKIQVKETTIQINS